MADHFAEKSRDWDVNDVVKGLSATIGPAIIDHVALTTDMDVLDFGAGTGLISAHIAPRVNKIVAVDISAAMLDKLAAKDELRGKVEVVCRDITTSPLAQQFDLIVSAMAMHHVSDTNQLIRTFANHLKPGGQIALADLDTEDGTFHPQNTAGVYHSGFDRAALQRVLEQHGFDDIYFFTPHSVAKNNRLYPVFLVTATKHFATFGSSL